VQKVEKMDNIWAFTESFDSLNISDVDKLLQSAKEKKENTSKANNKQEF